MFEFRECVLAWKIKSSFRGNMTSFDDFNKEEIELIINNEFPWYIKTLENCFDFKRWGFQMIYSGPVPGTHPTIVYESKICRVRFIWEVRDPRSSAEIIYILYGRLHAPIFSQGTMDWNGEECYCWHEVNKVLIFLDGLTPQEAFKNRKSPIFMWDFYHANINRGWRQAEMQARRQAAIWEYYGQRLFNIFDLNRPELWSEYEKFLKDYYIYVYKQNKVSETPGHTPYYKVC